MDPRLKKLLLTAAAVTMIVGPPIAARAQDATGLIHAGSAGRSAVGLDGTTAAELVTLRADLAARLLELSYGGSVLVTDWPTAAFERGTVELSRFDVYAPEARILEMRGDKAVEVPRSRLAFFRGLVAEDADERLLISVDPDSGRIGAYTARGSEVHELRSLGRGADGKYLLAPAASFLPPGEKPEWSCGQETSVADKLFLPMGTPQGVAVKAITTLHTATIAVDTDNELMGLKFSNSSSAATDYIANLFAAMNVIYERDLLIRLLQGLTILRPSTTADPYAQTASPANGNDLNEFSTYWAGGCGGACANTPRAAAVLLSGKSGSTFSASGIAWLNSLCSTTIGYSVNQVFKFAEDTSASDVMIVAHEIGHNVGSPHTHCYSPPVDNCFNTEPGCFSGTKACPAPSTYHGVTNVTGTLMSYCHLAGLSGCGSSPVFHPLSVNLLAPIIQSKVNQCVFPLGLPNSLFTSGFETGITPPWSAKIP
jgi:hypothetical protein